MAVGNRDAYTQGCLHTASLLPGQERWGLTRAAHPATWKNSAIRAPLLRTRQSTLMLARASPPGACHSALALGATGLAAGVAALGATATRRCTYGRLLFLWLLSALLVPFLFLLPFPRRCGAAARLLRLLGRTPTILPHLVTRSLISRPPPPPRKRQTVRHERLEQLKSQRCLCGIAAKPSGRPVLSHPHGTAAVSPAE